MKNQNFNLYTMAGSLFDKSVLQGVWANFLFALIGTISIFIIFSIANKRKAYRIFGLDKKNRLSIFFSDTFVQNAIDKQGNPNLYTGSAVPENEFKTIKELFNLLSLIGEKDNAFIRFMKFLTFDPVKIECELSPTNEIEAEANKEVNILTIGGPGYNAMTSYFQKEKTRLFFGSNSQDHNVFVDRINNRTIAKGSFDYDYGILERIVDENRVVILAYGFHINGTRGTVKYLVDNWKKLPKDFAYLIKFPHPSKDAIGYEKPLEVKNFI